MASAVLLGVPANLRITKNDDTRKRWAESGKYQHIRLDSDHAPTTRYPTGAEARWKKQANDVFLMDWRLVGTPEALTDALQANGVDRADITNSLRHAVTRDSAAGDRNFQAEIARVKSTRCSGGTRDKKVCADNTADMLESALAFYHGYKKSKDHEVKVAERKARSTKTDARSPGRRGGKPSSVLEMYEKLAGAHKLAVIEGGVPSGKVIDVSCVTASGSGARTQDAPKQPLTARGKKPLVMLDAGAGMVKVIPLVSDNMENYKMALDQIAGPAGLSAEERRVALEQFAVQLSKRAKHGEAKCSPKQPKQRSTSPARKASSRKTSPAKVPAPIPVPTGLPSFTKVGTSPRVPVPVSTMGRVPSMTLPAFRKPGQ